MAEYSDFALGRIVEYLITLLKIIILSLILLIIFFIIIKIYTEKGLTVLPFEIKNENLSGIAIADHITSDLLRIQQIHNIKYNVKTIAKNKDIFESELISDLSPGYSLVPKKEILEYSMAETGAITTSVGSLDPGRLIIAFKNICPARKPDLTIRGSLQRYGSNIALVAVLEGDNLQSWSVRQPVDKYNYDQLNEMIWNLSFRIAHDLPQSRVSAKTWEGLKYYTEALDAYNQYELTENLDAIDLAANYSLQAIASEKNYRNPYDLLRNVEFEYVRVGRQINALEICNDTIGLDPLSEYGWENKANVLHILNMTNDAISAYDNATKLNPQFAEAWNDKGTAFRELKKYDEAIRAYDEAIRIDPNYAYAWNNKGLALKGQQKYNEAISAYNEAIRINPKLAYTWNSKGLALKAQGELDKAIKAYSKATEINPRYADAWYNKGVALKTQENYDKSISAFDKVIQIDPNDFQAWSQRGSVLEAQGKYDEAIKAYNKAIELNPDYAISWYHKGVIFKLQGNSAEAEKALIRAKELGYAS